MRYAAKKIIDPVYGAFDSESEYARWLELVGLEKAGEVRMLRKEPVYVLSARPRCVFTPDADYAERDGPGWAVVVEDVKPQGGVVARDVYVRIAWLLDKHPEVSCVRLLRRASGRRPAKRGWRLVAGWWVREYRRERPAGARKGAVA